MRCAQKHRAGGKRCDQSGEIHSWRRQVGQRTTRSDGGDAIVEGRRQEGVLSAIAMTDKADSLGTDFGQRFQKVDTADILPDILPDAGPERAAALLRGPGHQTDITALGEFVRYALPGLASSPAVSVPAIWFALSSAIMSFEVVMAVRHTAVVRRPLHAILAALLLPALTTPGMSLLAIWSCRGNAVISLGLSNQTGEER